MKALAALVATLAIAGAALAVTGVGRPPCRVTAILPGGASGYGEGTKLAVCSDGARWLITSEPPCDESLGCRLVDALCWHAAKLEDR